jgi:hypothetical protein
MCNRKKIVIALNIMMITILTGSSCSSIQAGLYLVSIDDNNGESILENEPAVKLVLENIVDSYENYMIKAFSRTGVDFQLKRTRLVTHSYYVFIKNEGEYHTLSFYGTKMGFYSEGAWALDANSDVSSYRMFMEGNNRWDVTEIFLEEAIDVQETVRNIIKKIDSDITYYYRDHIINRPNMDNCNTALHETVVLVKRNEH